MSVTSALQSVLVDLVDLSLQAKQAHWNLQGRGFRSLHLQLDEIVEIARVGSDDVAERMAALDVAPDGTVARVQADSGIGEIATTWITVADAYDAMESKLQTASGNIKKLVETVDDQDPVSGDMLIGIAFDLDKQAWMLRAASASE